MLLLLGCASRDVIAVRVDARVEESTSVDSGDTGAACDEDLGCSGCNCNPPRVFDDHVELPSSRSMREDARVVFSVHYSGEHPTGQALSGEVTGVVVQQPIEVDAFGTSATPLYTIDADASLIPASDSLVPYSPSPLVSDDGSTLTFDYVNCGLHVREVHTLEARDPLPVQFYAGTPCCGWTEAPAWLGGMVWVLVAGRRRGR